jgi:hypothetical protein
MGQATNGDFEEKLKFLFQPDVLLPAQYFERMKRTDVRPEKALMLAVLEDAVCCFQKYCLASDRRGRILFKEAESWIFDGDDSGVFAYRNVCDVLGIDGDYLRQGLLRWKESVCHFA